MRLRLNEVLRLVLAVACLFPLGGPRAYAGFVTLAPAERAPFEEEDENERTDPEQRDVELRLERRHESKPSGTGVRLAPPNHRVAAQHSLPIRTTAEDPFRNGLGTPYRC